MEFQFDPNKEHQKAAIDAVVDLFKDQPPFNSSIEFGASAGAEAILGNNWIANNLDVPAFTLN